MLEQWIQKLKKLNEEINNVNSREKVKIGNLFIDANYFIDTMFLSLEL